MPTPSPSDVARRLMGLATSRRPSTRQRRLIARTCTDKERYDTAAAAADAVHVAHLTYAAKPMSYYPCPYCPGYHLTSADHREPRTLVEPRLPIPDLDPRSYAQPLVRRRNPGFARFQRSRFRRRVSRGKRYAAGEQAIDLLPNPHVATPEEARAFFAQNR